MDRIQQIEEDIRNYQEAIRNAEGALEEAERELDELLEAEYGDQIPTEYPE